MNTSIHWSGYLSNFVHIISHVIFHHSDIPLLKPSGECKEIEMDENVFIVDVLNF
jgi:hypothetical protein